MIVFCQEGVPTTVSDAKLTPTPEAILAHLDGDANPAVAAYLQASPEGAALAAAYASVGSRLTLALYRHECPPTAQLGDYALGLLAAAERFAVAAHADACPLCTAELAQIRAFLTIEADPPLPSVGERLRRTLTALLAPPPATAYAGLRGDGDDDTRTYQAEDVTITLDIAASTRRGRSSLTGLIWRDRDDAASPTGTIVSLTAADGVQTATIDEFGNFSFDDLPHAEYHLELILGDDAITIGPITIGPPPAP